MFSKTMRWFSLVLFLALLLPLVQPVWAAQQSFSFLTNEPAALPDNPSDGDYAEVDLVFESIDALENKLSKKSSAQTQLTNTVIALVEASDGYVEGSLKRNGNSFTWWTDSGIRCVYSPHMREMQKNLTPESGENVIVNEPRSVKAGNSSGKQVYLIGPYYGYDSTFDNRYRREASRIANVIGDTDGYTLYSGTAATVDKVAEAVSKGSVVIFNSHGSTDYENPQNEADRVTGATNSYLCLSTASGATSADYADGALYHNGELWVNGEVIANHMTQNSPSGILWMPICLGMATDTLCNPLRRQGVEVVYGYSDSVTVAADYLFEDVFWDEMCKGNTVAASIATMKSTWGHWELSGEMAEHYTFDNVAYTQEQAQAYYHAFPVVVSDEDPYPGQRSATSFGVSAIQAVASLYTLGELNLKFPGPTRDYYQEVMDYIYTYGIIDNQGIPTRVVSYDDSNIRYSFRLQVLPEGIRFSFMQNSEQPTYVYTYLEFMLQKSGDILPTDYQFGYYYEGNLSDRLVTSTSINRSTLTKSSVYSVPGGNYIPSEDTSWYFNRSLQYLCDYWDIEFYNNLGFGLKALGFVSYEGCGNLPCSHHYDHGCDPDCNSCGETRLTSHNYLNGICTLCQAPDPDYSSVGDFNNDTFITNDDVVCLLWYTLFPEEYTIVGGDINHDSYVDNSDVIYLLWYTLFPEEYPLS